MGRGRQHEAVEVPRWQVHPESLGTQRHHQHRRCEPRECALLRWRQWQHEILGLEDWVLLPGYGDCGATGVAGKRGGHLHPCFDQTGSRLITCEADKTVKIWKEDEEATPETHPIEFKEIGNKKKW